MIIKLYPDDRVVAACQMQGYVLVFTERGKIFKVVHDEIYGVVVMEL